MDFFITDVRYSEDGSFIERVLIRRRYVDEKGDRRVGPPRDVLATFINDLLKTEKVKIHTAMHNGNGWQEGEEVICYEDDYITTKSNSTEKDNLGELPEF